MSDTLDQGALDSRALTRDLARLVAFPTVSGRPVTALATWLAGRYEALGYRVEWVPLPGRPGACNLVATVGPDAPGGLCVTGHMDVVPVEGQPWSGDPFTLRERDGRLIGRGTADMKGFLAACLHALAVFRPGDFRRPLALIWTCEEEAGCHGSAELARAWRDAGRRLPSACLVGEPTGLRVLRRHAGHVSARLELRGAAAHSARPERGANAIVAAAAAVGALAGLAVELGARAEGRVPLNIATIAGGAAINIVPDRCTLEIGFRPPPGEDHAAIWRAVQERIASLALPAGTRAELALGRVTPSMQTPAGTELEALLRPHARPPQGDDVAPYATDGGNLALLGARPLICGPGRIEVAHRADEHVSLAALLRATRMVREVVRARCCR